mgnify:CR=1 FL=1|jgi:lipoprotein
MRINLDLKNMRWMFLMACSWSIVLAACDFSSQSQTEGERKSGQNVCGGHGPDSRKTGHGAKIPDVFSEAEQNRALRYQIKLYVAERIAESAMYGYEDFRYERLITLQQSLSGDTLVYRVEQTSDFCLFYDRPQYLYKIDDIYVLCYCTDAQISVLTLEELISSLAEDYPNYRRDYESYLQTKKKFAGFLPIGDGLIFEGDYYVLKFYHGMMYKTVCSELGAKDKVVSASPVFYDPVWNK